MSKRAAAGGPMRVPHASSLFAARTASSTRSPRRESRSSRQLFRQPTGPQIRKMQQVKRAASTAGAVDAQDRRVAAEAERKILQARQEIREGNEQVVAGE